MSASARVPAVALAALGVALLSAMDAVIKHLTGTVGTLEIAFGRYLAGTLAAGAIWVSAGRPAITLDMLKAHGPRGLVVVGAATSFFYALGQLPLAKAITLAFVAPLLIPFAAWAVLGERPRPRNLLAGAVGFAGAWIALGGDVTRLAPSELRGAAAVLLSAILYALSLALLRQRAERDGPAVVGLLQTLIPCAILAGPALVFGSAPPAAIWPSFLLMGALGAAGWYALIRAYARAEAQTLAPLEFTALVWAVLLGFIFFQETPAAETLLGAGVIVAAALAAAWDERRLARAAARALNGQA